MAFLDDALANTSSISDTQASAFATSRLISFLGPKILGQDKAYSLSTIDIPEAGIIDWMNVNLYDINGRILFRDKTLLLPDGREIRLRVAASALLRVPVWSVGVGMPFDLVAASLSAKVRAQEMGLSFETGEQSLVCYCYPKLGILCRNDRGNKVVIDLTDFNVSSVEASSLVTSSEQKTTWSPYDLVVPSTLGSLISKWDTTVALMPAVEADGAMIIPDNNVQTPAIETIVN